jgi:hypothetical protein
LRQPKYEYLDRNDEMLSGPDQRYAGTILLGAVSRGKMSDAQADQAIDVMRCLQSPSTPKPPRSALFLFTSHVRP